MILCYVVQKYKILYSFVDRVDFGGIRNSLTNKYNVYKINSGKYYSVSECYFRVISTL